VEELSLRTRLPRDLTWMLAACLALSAAVTAWSPRHGLGLGWDAHAYWAAWQGGMYDGAPATKDAFLYSPAFAQAVWPVAQLPWPLFCALFVVISAIGIAWLVAPTGRQWAPALWLACLPETLSGNIYWALAMAAVLGFRFAGAWALAALTKITPALGPVWFIARGELRRAAVSVGTTVSLGALSYLLAPDLWQQWFDFLRSNLGVTTGSVGSRLFPGPVVRVPIAIALTAWAARTDRVWVLPVTMVLASPVIGLGTFALLTAIPRLRATSDAGSTGAT
jgi:hypothetical protein